MRLRRLMARTYWWLEPRLAPGVRYAQADFEELLFETAPAGGAWLDVGCGHALLPEWRRSAEECLVGIPGLLVGLDPERSALQAHEGIPLRTCGDAGTIPFRDRSFDLVTANMVVEHLAEPRVQFREIARILKPGGRFVFHTPCATGYPTLLARAVPDVVRGWAARIVEGRAPEDRFPTYYRANTRAAIERAARDAGLAVESLAFLRSSAMFGAIPPLAVLELLVLRMLASPSLAGLRPNLIAVLTKPPAR